MGARRGADNARSAVTRRSVVIGLLLVPLNVWWVIAAELRWYVVLTLNPLFVTPVFYLFVLACLNTVNRRLCPRLVLRPGELVVIYLMLVLSCTIATHDFIINLMSIMGWAAWFSTPENDWSTLMFPHLPRWLLVWDKGALEGYFSGSSSLYSPHVLRAWLAPLAFWSVFIFAVGWMMMCMTVLVRKAWMDDTRLSFPIVRLPLVLTEEPAPGSTFLSKGLWIGFGLAFALGVVNGLHEWFPMLPALNVRARYLNFTVPPWTAASPMWISWYPFGIGLAYLVPVDVSFSCWFFYLFFKAQAVIGHRMGFGSVPDMPFVHEQEIGAWYAFGVSLLVLYRRYIVRIVRQGIGLDPAEDSDEPMSYRAAFRGLAAGSLVFMVFWKAAGMSLVWVVVGLVTYLLVSLSITRIRAEAGGQHNVWDLEPMNLMRLFDSHSLGGGNLGAGALSHWYWRLNRCHPMPAMFEGFKLAQEHDMRLRDLVKPMLAAFAVATIAGMWACLQVFYSEGALAKTRGFAFWTGVETFNWLDSSLRNGFRPEISRWAAAGSGGALVVLLSAVRTRCAWFPFHPLGYCMGAELRWLWFPFFVAWLIKATVLRFGGLSLYRRSLGFFLGLVLGDYVVGAVWSLIGVVFHVPALQIFH